MMNAECRMKKGSPKPVSEGTPEDPDRTPTDPGLGGYPQAPACAHFAFSSFCTLHSSFCTESYAF
jgi:hypothetical protein